MTKITLVKSGSTESNRFLLLMLVMITALGTASAQVFLPALPAVQFEFGISPGIAQLGLSLPMLAMAFSDLGYGPWSDRVGRRPVLLVGLYLFLLGNLICFTAGSFWMLVVGRILVDCGGAVGIVLSRAIALDIYGREKAARVISITLAAMVVGPMLGPLAGGLLTDTFGWRTIFIFLFLIGISILLFAQMRFKESHTERGTDQSLKEVRGWFVKLLRSRHFNTYAWHSAFIWGVFMAFIGAAPYVMVNLLGKSSMEFGMWLIPSALGYVVGNLLSMRFSTELGSERMIRIGSLVVLASVIILAGLMFSGFWFPWAIFLPTSITALGAGITIPNAQALAVDALPEASGSASGLIGFMMMVTGAFAVQSVGLLQGDTPYPMAGIMMGMALMAFLVLRFSPPAPPASPT